jgi:gas vesicle protein GvpA/GvpJ/GvpM family
MARRRSRASKPTTPPKALVRRSDDWLFPALATSSDVGVESSLLDVVDNVLNKGMLLNGDLILGVANVDLIYAKLSVLLAALDKITDERIFRPIAPPPKRKRRKK